MRVTYRYADNKDYWAKRWEVIPVDLPMENKSVYPLKYSESIITNKNNKILEAGCGAGRILRYYHNNGYNIIGIDFIEIAINKLKKEDPELQAEIGDITNLRFADNSFDCVLAFGLFHNLEHGLDQAVNETYRVLKSNGKVCASFRADNIQTKLNDWLTEMRNKKNYKKKIPRQFHKLNLTRNEFEDLFKKTGFIVESIYQVVNMPILYKFKLFRSRTHKSFNENLARAEGYRLSWLGQSLQFLLMKCFPDQFCNIYVLIARKGN